MKKVSTRAAAQSGHISQQKLTIGWDLGDRNSWYCVLDESGQIQLEQRVRTTGKALPEVLRRHAAQSDRTGNRDAFALDQPPVKRVGARTDRGPCAQAAADRGEWPERRSAGWADAGAAGPDRSGVAVSGEASQRYGAGRSPVIGARAGWVRARTALVNTCPWTGPELWRAVARLQRAQPESGESRPPEPGNQESRVHRPELRTGADPRVSALRRSYQSSRLRLPPASSECRVGAVSASACGACDILRVIACNQDFSPTEGSLFSSRGPLARRS